MRDPFGRFTVRRTREHGAACAFCCVVDRTPKPASVEVQGAVYRYRTEHDGGRTDVDPKTFCSSSCRKAYY